MLPIKIAVYFSSKCLRGKQKHYCQASCLEWLESILLQGKSTLEWVLRCPCAEGSAGIGCESTLGTRQPPSLRTLVAQGRVLQEQQHVRMQKRKSWAPLKPVRKDIFCLFFLSSA